jgi:hypothetical protein
MVDRRLRVGCASTRKEGAVVGCGDLLASPLIRKVRDQRQVSDQSGRLAQRTPSGRYRRAPTFIRRMWTTAPSLLPPLSLAERVDKPGSNALVEHTRCGQVETAPFENGNESGSVQCLHQQPQLHFTFRDDSQQNCSEALGFTDGRLNRCAGDRSIEESLRVASRPKGHINFMSASVCLRNDGPCWPSGFSAWPAAAVVAAMWPTPQTVRQALPQRQPLTQQRIE